MIKLRKKRNWTIHIAVILAVAIVAGGFLREYEPEINTNAIPAINTPVARIEDNISGNAYIIDGDTIKINGTNIRFHGVDAPEISQPCWKNKIKYQCGLKAKAYLQRLINNQTVICQTVDKDRYGRHIAKCFNYENKDINAMMVSSGNAIAYLYYTEDYAAQQDEAKSNKRGIWAGRFTKPYQYRKMMKK